MRKRLSADRLRRWRGFPLLWVATLVNGLGSNLLGFALPLYVFQLTGEASAASMAFIFGSLPRVLIGPVGGAIADRRDRRRLIAACNALAALAMVPMLTVRDAQWVWLLFACRFGEHALAQISRPAEGALIPLVAGRERLGRANSLLSAAGTVIRLAGPALGGLVYGVAGFRAVVLLNLASYLVTAGMILLLRTPPQCAVHLRPRQPARMLADILSGFRLMGESAMLAGITAINAPAMAAEGITNALWVVWVTGYLGADPGIYGGVESFAGAGALAGSLLLARRLDGPHPHRVFLASTAAIGVILLLIVTFPSIPLTAALIFVVGPANIAFFVETDIVLQRSTADTALGRVLGAFSAIRGTIQIAGAFLAQQLVDGLGVRSLIGLAAICWLAAALVTRLTLASDRDIGETGDWLAGDET